VLTRHRRIFYHEMVGGVQPTLAPPETAWPAEQSGGRCYRSPP